jgi:gliding motility-associated-like protein
MYNKWGEMVFETTRAGEGWDGKYRGIPQPSDVFVFVCQYETVDGIKRAQKGTITLIR